MNIYSGSVNLSIPILRIDSPLTDTILKPPIGHSGHANFRNFTLKISEERAVVEATFSAKAMMFLFVGGVFPFFAIIVFMVFIG